MVPTGVVGTGEPKTDAVDEVKLVVGAPDDKEVELAELVPTVTTAPAFCLFARRA